MTYEFDGDPLIRSAACEVCGRGHETATGFVLQDGDAHAVYFAAWYPHSQEAYLDVVLGSFEDDEVGADRVTFGCRIGHVDDQAAPAASLVTAGRTLSDSPEWGRRLDRPAALAHPHLAAFWQVVDWLILNDPVLHEHVFHLPPGDG